MTAKHTPLPWRLAGGMSGNGGYISSDNGYIPLCTPFTEKAHRDKFGGATPEAQVNAALIVRAVNSHTDLLEACKAAYKELTAPTTASNRIAAGLALEAAIAKAQGAPE